MIRRFLPLGLFFLPAFACRTHPAPVAISTPAPAATVAASSHGKLVADPIRLPGAGNGIGFDDLGWAPHAGRVIVPAGRSGKLDLIDPATRDILAIGGFSAEPDYAGGHGAGTTSADEGGGLVFAIDRTKLALVVVDPAAAKIVAAATLASAPDYVRFVAPTHELWVTEPGEKRIEIFSMSSAAVPALTHAAFIAVPGGPESLVVDATRGRAWTHLWKDSTLGIDLKARRIVERYPNGCGGSRGIALDEKRGWLFAGCDEGRAVVLDLANGGKALSSATTGAGVDIIAYDAQRRHLYVPGGDSATLTILGVGEKGALTKLAEVETARDAHCVTADGRGGVWVCDPGEGRILRYEDVLP